MSDEDFTSVVGGVMALIGVGLFIWFCFWFFPKVGHWWTNTVFPVRDYYCASLKKIVKAEPIYEDNGKYEDEAYRVTYEDNTVGLISNAALQSGYYCMSEAYLSPDEAAKRGWVLRP